MAEIEAKVKIEGVYNGISETILSGIEPLAATLVLVVELSKPILSPLPIYRRGGKGFESDMNLSNDRYEGQVLQSLPESLTST